MVIQLILFLSSSARLVLKVVVSTWLSYLIRQDIYIGGLPKSLVLVSLVILYCLYFLLLQGTLLICTVVMRVV